MPFLRTIGAIALTALTATTVAHAAPNLLPPKGFDVFAVDGKGGGWVIHHLTGRGDTLWGCADLANVSSCKQVYFNEWKTASRFSMIHVSKDSQNAWVRLSAPAMGDYLYACKTPEGEPTCKLMDLELRMKGPATIARTWPAYQCNYACDKDDERMKDNDPRYFIEDKAQADMWIQVGIVPGPTNMYACRGLAGDATCQLAIPNWLALDRQDLGFKKIEDIVTEGPDGEKIYGPGVRVGKIDEAGAAYGAGFREGDVILKVGPFDVNKAVHANYMMAQYPALTAIVFTKEDGSTIEVTPQRKPQK